MTEQSRSQNTTAGESTFRKTNTGHNVPADHTNVDNRNKNINTTDIKKNIKIRPPPIQYDPDAIFGGDSDEDPYDYSEDEEELHTNYHACFTPGPGYDPGPCAPRPLSQDQPTTEGLRAWNESRGLFFWGKTSLTLLDEVDITPLYPLFTPARPLTIDRHMTETPPAGPLIQALPQPPNDWSTIGTSSCEAETEAACCSCEPDNTSLNPTHLEPSSSLDPPDTTPLAAQEEQPLTSEPSQTPSPHVCHGPCDLDGRADQPYDEKGKPQRPAGNPKPRQPKRTSSAPKRPWLTPPSPSNMAWRGWTTSKTTKLKVKPISESLHLHDFSLSANERPRVSIRRRHDVSRPSLSNTTPPVGMKTYWMPRSAARRRLERLRSLHPPARKNSSGQPRFSRNLIPLPSLNLDYPPENKKSLEYKTITDSPITDPLDNNKTITVIPPFINLLDSFPEYKTLMYWEVKAG